LLEYCTAKGVIFAGYKWRVCGHCLWCSDGSVQNDGEFPAGILTVGSDDNLYGVTIGVIREGLFPASSSADFERVDGSLLASFHYTTDLVRRLVGDVKGTVMHDFFHGCTDPGG
jgi:hypothetical protein